MSTAERIRAGDIRLASRLIRNLEDKNPRAREVVKELFPFTGNARVLGLTGAPGAGKSTITDRHPALASSVRLQLPVSAKLGAFGGGGRVTASRPTSVLVPIWQTEYFTAS